MWDKWNLFFIRNTNVTSEIIEYALGMAKKRFSCMKEWIEISIMILP